MQTRSILTKTFILGLSAALLSLSAVWYGMPAAAAQESITKDVVMTIQDVYVPGGLSQDADSYVVINGTYPNSCYSWGRSEVHRSGDFNHEIRAIAKVNQGMCLMVIVPYNHDVRLGKLSSGRHTLKFINGDGTYFERQLIVE